MSPASSALLTLTLGIAVLAAGPTTAAAQNATSSPPRPPRQTCDAPEHRQLDFWVGDWNVTVNGQAAGTNRVTREEAGCLIHEHWTGAGAGGGTGQSFNFYDRADRKWHQVWVASNGSVLRLSGARAGDRLVYAGESAMPGGVSRRHRLTFFDNGDRTVRQL